MRYAFLMSCQKGKYELDDEQGPHANTIWRDYSQSFDEDTIKAALDEVDEAWKGISDDMADAVVRPLHSELEIKSCAICSIGPNKTRDIDGIHSCSICKVWHCHECTINHNATKYCLPCYVDSDFWLGEDCSYD